MTENVLPPIERWWPLLDMRFKHEILVDLDALVNPEALAHVAELSGEAIHAGLVTLSSADKDYVCTQIESVD